jgi:N-methylhydantoinase B
MRVVGANGGTRQLQVNAFHDIGAGDIFELISQGGGGFGDPLERDPALVLQDVVNGYVSCEKALADYGVVLARREGEWSIDLAATNYARATRKFD